MSRRRSSREQHRHLEQTEEVAHLLQDREASRGPCPGSCNRLHRVRSAEYAVALDRARHELAAAETERLMVEALSMWPADSQDLDEIAAWVRTRLDLAADRIEGEAMNRAAAEVNVPDARPGLPVWCRPCAANVRAELDVLPQLIAWTLDIGRVEVPRRPDGSDPYDPVAVLDVLKAGPGWVSEVLACGHRHSRPLPPVGYGAAETRACRTCIATVIIAEPGRLAPTPKVGAGKASARPKVSPAGSPVWLEADAAIEWVCSRAEQARVLLGQEPLEYDWRSGSTTARFKAATAAARHLESSHEGVLSSVHAESWGREAHAVAARLRRVSGMDDLVHRLPVACPRCDRKALARKDGGSIIKCDRCGSVWDEQYYQHLARVQAFEANHPEMQEATTDE